MGPSGVGGARLEGWPPLFPDASVRGEVENIASDVDFGMNATDEPKLTNATDGPNDNVLFVGKVQSTFQSTFQSTAQAVGRSRGVSGHGTCPCRVVARIGSRG